MKKLAIGIVILVAIVVGCARPAVNTTILPLAYIDSVSAPQIVYGDTVKFAGHGISTTGQVVAYDWISSINGELSKQATFETNQLFAGAHTIWFRVQDNYGNWSKGVGINVNVLVPGSPTKMQIKIFDATPPAIREGESSTLIWEVSGTGSVKITPDVGAVAPVGSRSVKPKQDTLYTLIATNEEGGVSALTQVAVSAIPVHVMNLYSVANEDGTVLKDKTVLEQVLVGENENQIQMQGFLSYDISAIPANAVIKRVELDLRGSTIYGSPFPWQGALNIYNFQYGTALRPINYMVNVPSGYIFSWVYNSVATMMPDRIFSSPDMAAAVQRQADNREKRFQIRIQFEKYYYYVRPAYTPYYLQDWNTFTYANYVDIGAGNPRLSILYVVPQ